MTLKDFYNEHEKNDKKTKEFLSMQIARENQKIKDLEKQKIKNRRKLPKDYLDLFCNDENYYYNSWINGNKNHVITHLRIFSSNTDIIFYNAILRQFAHDKDLLENILNKVTEQAGTFINKAYL